MKSVFSVSTSDYNIPYHLKRTERTDMTDALQSPEQPHTPTPAAKDTAAPDRRPPSITDVAEAAKVSLGTVSNFFNYPDRISDNMRRRVEEAIRQVGYHRQRATPSPARQSKTLVAMVMASVENSIYSSVFQGAQAVLADHGMRLIAANSLTDAHEQMQLVETFLSLPVAGMLLATPNAAPQDVARTQAAGIPVVAVDHVERNGQGGPCCCVAEDNVQGGRLAAQLLIERGCERLVYAGRGFEFQPVEERYEGILRAVRHDAPDMDVRLMDARGFLFEDGLDLGRDIDELHPHGSGRLGVIACSDTVANGIATALSDRIPDEVMVVGTEGNLFAERAPIRLTTIDNPGEHMGRQAAQLLLDDINAGSGHRHITVMCAPTPHMRESTGCAE